MSQNCYISLDILQLFRSMPLKEESAYNSIVSRIVEIFNASVKVSRVLEQGAHSELGASHIEPCLV